MTTPRRPSLPEDAKPKPANAKKAARDYANGRSVSGCVCETCSRDRLNDMRAFSAGVRWERARRKREGTC